MPEVAQKKKVEERLHILTNALEQGTLQHVWKMLNDLHPAEIAKLLESLRPGLAFFGNGILPDDDSSNHKN